MRVAIRSATRIATIMIVAIALREGLLVSQTQSAPIDADLLVTAAPVYLPLAALSGGERFPKGARLLLIHAGKPEPLVPGFAASADANVSFDGERVLFSGKQAATDSWQIWELTLKGRALRKIVAGDVDAIRPLYLPAGRLAYARRTAHGFQLETAGKDASYAFAPIDDKAGDTLLALSYVPGNAIPADVLLDGRILFESKFPLGAGSTPELFLVYSDGSGVESYRCDHGVARWGGKQLASGDVVFTHGKALARFTSPLAHEAAIQMPHAEYAGAVAETTEGTWLVSAREGPGTAFVLSQWNPSTGFKKTAPSLKTVLAMKGENVVEPVLVAPRTRPKRHPSGLHDWSYANLLALDARQSRQGDLKIAPKQVRLEALDDDGHPRVLGTAPVEADGSFYVKTPADRPIRFAILDEKGSVVRSEHGWFWIRRGEQRYCVGCHTGPERSSDNHVPAVLLRTTTPVDLTGAKGAAPTHEASGGN